MKLVAVSAGLSTPSSTRLLAVAIANNLVTGFPSPPLAAAIGR